MVFVAVLTACVLAPTVCSAQPNANSDGTPQFWGALTAGQYSVGFKRVWVHDPTRRYDIKYSDGSSYAEGDPDAIRPIMINIWYPAVPKSGAARMPHGAYLDIVPQDNADPQLVKFALELQEYDRNVVCQEVLGSPYSKLDSGGLTSFNSWLGTRTAAVMDADPVTGSRFPLVIYHSGYGSSFEDNAVLCEFLASHGYVVMGSPFQSGRGDGFNIDSYFDSYRDIEFLIKYSASLGYVDTDKIALIGHSGGAHAALRFNSQPNSVLDAVVSLDTTQDYYSTVDRRWDTLEDTVLSNIDNMKGRILMVANPNAYFQLADQCVNAERTYLTLRDLDHSDFIAQGVIAAERTARAKGASQEETDRAVAVRKEYDQLCSYILLYLDAYVKSDGSALSEIKDRYTNTSLDGADPHVVNVAKGKDGPEPYVRSDTPPTPRQLRRMIDDDGAAAAARAITDFYKAHPDDPIYHFLFSTSILYEMVVTGRLDDAKTISKAYLEIHPDLLSNMAHIAQAWGRVGRKQYASIALQVVKKLDPGLPGLDEMIREFPEKGGGSRSSPSIDPVY